MREYQPLSLGNGESRPDRDESEPRLRRVQTWRCQPTSASCRTSRGAVWPLGSNCTRYSCPTCETRPPMTRSGQTSWRVASDKPPSLSASGERTRFSRRTARGMFSCSQSFKSLLMARYSGMSPAHSSGSRGVWPSCTSQVAGRTSQVDHHRFDHRPRSSSSALRSTCLRCRSAAGR